MTRFATLILILWALPVVTKAQNMYQPSAYEISTLPLWAQKMYGENPNFLEVDSLYRDYYRKNPFIKSYHTQYFKRGVAKRCY